MNKVKEVLKGWSLFEMLWLTLFTAVGLYLSVVWGESIIGLLTFLTGIICVVLVAKGSLWNYAFGIVNVIGYAYISLNNRLFGEVMLNALYFLPMQFIGYYMWKKAMGVNAEVLKRKLNATQNLVLIGVVALFVMAYQQGLIYLGGSLTLLDAMSTVVSVIAMLLMAYRYREQWVLWIVVNVVSIIMWIQSGDMMMTLMWGAYLVNALYGLYKWSKEGKLNV